MTDHDVTIIGAGFGGMGAAITLKRAGVRADSGPADPRARGRPGRHLARQPLPRPGRRHRQRHLLLLLRAQPPLGALVRSRAPSSRGTPSTSPTSTTCAGTCASASRSRAPAGTRTSSTGSWPRRARRPARATHTSRFLMTATGFLSQPRLPDIEGVHDFAGEVIHTAKWDDDADLDRQAGGGDRHRRDRRTADPGDRRRGVRAHRLPAHPDLGDPEDRLQDPAVAAAPVRRAAVDPAARAPGQQRLARGVDGVRGAALPAGPDLQPRRQRRCRKRHLRKQVEDPELRRKLTPDYSFGCKRPTFSNDYFPTFTRDHVTLETTPIERITPTGVVTTDGRETQIDTLVLATGFNLWDVNFPAIEVIGRDGRNLGKWWREQGYSAYEGVTVPQFPNFVTLNSPYSYSGLELLHDHRGADAPPRAALRRAPRPRRGDLRDQRACECGVPVAMLERMDDTVFNLGACATSRSYYFTNEGDAVILRPTSSDARTGRSRASRSATTSSPGPAG